MKDKEGFLDGVDRQEGGSAGVEGLEERYWMRFLKGMVTDCNIVYISTADLSLPKGQASKLLPKYVSPFKVTRAHTNTSSYEVELPAQLQAQNLHNQFHQSKLHPYHANDDALFPHREILTYYDFGLPDDQEWLVDEILSYKWDKSSILFQVRWNLGDTIWEPFKTCKDPQALTHYLQLIGVKDPYQLP
jgi:hypothetical protein